MSRSGKLSKTFEFLLIFFSSQEAAEKNKEKVEANCTGFSAEVFGSQSVEMFRFCQENKNSNVDNLFPELDKSPPTSS